MTILVTGGRGHVARAVVDGLLGAGERVRVASRDPEKAVLPDGVETVRADLSDPDTLPAALAGVTKVFLYADAKGVDGFVAAAEAAGAPHTVLLSTSSLTRENAENNPIAQMHAVVENRLRDSALPWTFLRPGTFATNTLQWAPAIRATGTVRAPYPQAHASAIHEADIADIAVRTFTEPGHEGKAYLLSGPESVTQQEQIECLSEAIGRKLRLEEVTPEEYRATLSRWGGNDFIDQLLEYLAMWDGKPMPVCPAYTELTGRRGRTYAQWAFDHAADFQPVG
ncbi:NAD dependent epimerase/dehydratase [Streptomyces himastatinicus ATCC 53653]|uniref:NAD dependent epimerase/dehydratase n=1 Tax=Streptomyces himastatinicus ATCC 53653 TaxID=457427 RepID=D9W8E9_9ACTN|nr:NAD(P)H-binding protein [Streptomyces himastatinicus]EFL22656.1 NAD dependent epimerase/dehydratase [Streptomyces himastatinicus ATCC 53653]